MNAPNELFKSAVTGQFQAALAMLTDCIERCPPGHWDGIVGKYPFWLVAYHTLCFCDLYLSPNKESFQLRSIHPAGWSEFDEEYPSRRFEQRELTEYAAICREKLSVTLDAETAESLAAPSGFPRQPFTRGELHIYAMRHVAHHAGQLSAFLRRVEPSMQDPQALRWVKSGWR